MDDASIAATISNAPSFQISEVSELLDYLMIINSELQTDLRVPAEFDDKYVDAARLLAEGIRTGRVAQPEGVFSFTITDPAVVAAVLPQFEKEALSLQLTMLLRLGDSPIDPGPVTIEMVRPRIAERRDVEDGVRVGLAADQTFYVFERWKDKAAAVSPAAPDAESEGNEKSV